MLTKEELEDIIAKYNRGEDTGYTDEEYDVLLEEYLKEHGEEQRPFLRQKQSDNINTIVGTLKKVYGVTDPMRPGQKTYHDWVSKYSTMDEKRYSIIIQAKFDGLSVAYDCETGQYFTRGDYDDGESVNVTDLVTENSTIVDSRINVKSMKYEAIMSNENYRRLAEMGYHYKSARAAASAIITSRNQNLMKFITFMPLRCYADGKMYTARLFQQDPEIGHTGALFDYCTIQKFIDHLLDNGPFVTIMNHTFAVDGCVISVVNQNREILDEVAIKIIKDIKETKLKNIEFQFGKQGRITPVAVFEPIQFGKNTVDHATLSIVENCVGLKQNDTIHIMYNIVPYFVRSEYDGKIPIPIPTTCPYCKRPLSTSSKLVKCTNPRCDGIVFGGIVRYCQTMRMFGISEGILKKLWDLRLVRSIGDLYQLKVEMISDIEGFGEKSANNIVSSIHDNSQDVPFERFLGALPINDTSVKTWRTVLDGCQVTNPLLFGTIDDFIMNIQPIDGIGEITIRKITDGVRCNLTLLQHLIRNNHVTVILPQKREGKRVAMTGTRDKELTAYLEEHGYVVDSFTKDCVALIVPDHDFVSAKTVKAKELGIPIYTVKEGYEL